MYPGLVRTVGNHFVYRACFTFSLNFSSKDFFEFLFTLILYMQN